MKEAIEKYGAGRFEVPEGGQFLKIDRYSGQRLPDTASGDYVVSEYFREGEEPLFGMLAVVDGGFGMSSDLPIFGRGEADDLTLSNNDSQVTTATGQTIVVPRASFGTLSSGGLY